MKKYFVWLVLFVCAALPLAAPAQVGDFDALYVFGDSLSDTGNDLVLTKLLGIKPAIPPSESPNRTYFNGRFSNGPIAFEYLWQALTANSKANVVPSLALPNPNRNGAISYAFGGATSGLYSVTPGGFVVPGLLGQVEAYRFGLSGKKPKQRALFAIWAGANDYINLTPADPLIVVKNIGRGIRRLYQIGARQFIVLNLPDLGQIPAAQGNAAALSQLTSIHNALLDQTLNGLSETLPGISVTKINVFNVAQSLLGSTIPGPALEFLAPGFSACLLINPATCPDVELTLSLPFFYWDVEHPTTLVHSVLGSAMFGALAPPP